MYLCESTILEEKRPDGSIDVARGDAPEAECANWIVLCVVHADTGRI